MADFPPPPQSKKAVVKAGEALSGTLPHNPERFSEYVRLFRIAHDWRGSHVLPLGRITRELQANIRKTKLVAVTAARVKRMWSIRRKLARSTTTLTQMQDIGGCRAIVRSMEDLNRLVALYRNSSTRHSRIADTSYISDPKSDGYRSHHLVFAYCAPNSASEALNGRRIEVQLRTQLQHSWATAVEAIGLYTRENLKGGEGSPDWLRLFSLISAEFADAEGAGAVPGMPAKSRRQEEIVALDKKLDAAKRLAQLNQAFKISENYITGSKFFLIRYDREKHTVDVSGYNSMKLGNDEYSAQERGNIESNAVLVEVARVEDLRTAYPNYFFDVALFVRNFRNIMAGYPLVLHAEEQARPKNPDLSWVNTYHADRTNLRSRKRRME
jgi:ppGpp synthetase/RelA/SpoT-type nucleotidyltranferase